MRWFLLFFCLLIHSSVSLAQKFIYVSPSGNDAGSGVKSSPFRTLEKAKEVVREHIKEYTDDITVFIHPGVYVLSRTLVFSGEDGGKDGQLIIWQGDDQNLPVITSGVELKGWKRSKGLMGLASQAKGNIWEAPIPQGSGLFKTLFDHGIEQPRALGPGFKSRVDAFGRDGQGELRSRTKMYVDENAYLGTWENISDLELVIRPFCLWTMNILPVKEIDQENRSITTEIPGSYYLTKERYMRFPDEHAWIANTPEGMTEPGNWCVNTIERKIYYWPVSGEPGKVTIPLLREYIRIEGEIDYNGPRDMPVRNLTFRNLKFINNERDTWNKDDMGIQHDWEMMDKDNAFFRFRGAENCTLEACEFAHGGGSGIRLDLHCQRITVSGNYIHDIGGTGILLCGYGAGQKDVNKNNVVDNNCIQRGGKHYWHNAGIAITQSGENRISHNLISQMPYNGMCLTGYRLRFFSQEIKDALDRSRTDPGFYEEYIKSAGAGLRENARSIRFDEVRPMHNDNKSHIEFRDVVVRNLLHYQPYIHGRFNYIECNEVSHVLQVLGDGNGLYISDPGPYNVVRNNFFHHAEGVHGVAIRTDHLTHNTLIESNIIWKFAGGLAVSHNNIAMNNIIADVGGVTMTEGGLSDTKRVEVIIDYSRTTGYQDGLILQNVGYQSANRVPYFGNLSKIDTSRMNIVDDNYYFWQGHCAEMEHMLDSLKLYGFDPSSRVIDPMFKNPDEGDFRLRHDSPLPGLGFGAIDQGSMGLLDTFPFDIESP